MVSHDRINLKRNSSAFCRSERFCADESTRAPHGFEWSWQTAKVATGFELGNLILDNEFKLMARQMDRIRVTV